MASPCGSVEGVGSLERLVQKRVEVKIAREAEDSDRAAQQKKEDEELKKSQEMKLSTLKDRHSAHLQQKRSDFDAILLCIEARHAKELAALRKQHTEEIEAQGNKSEQQLCESRTIGSIGIKNLLRKSEDENRAQLDVRQREEEKLQQRRAEEDGQLRDKLLAAVNEEFRGNTRQASTSPATTQIVGNKRTDPTETNLPENVSRNPKRQKLDESSQFAAHSPSASSSTTATAPSTPRATFAVSKPMSGVKFKLPASPQKTGGDSALKTSFAIKFFFKSTRPQPVYSWRASPDQKFKYLHRNTGKRTFEVYDGDRYETTHYPGWVIDNTGRHAKQLFHTRATARILFLAEELHEHVRVEFKDVKEFDAFISLFIACNEPKFCKVFAKEDLDYYKW